MTAVPAFFLKVCNFQLSKVRQFSIDIDIRATGRSIPSGCSRTRRRIVHRDRPYQQRAAQNPQGTAGDDPLDDRDHQQSEKRGRIDDGPIAPGHAASPVEPLAGHQDHEHGSQLQRYNGIRARKRGSRHTAAALTRPNTSTGENQTKPRAGLNSRPGRLSRQELCHRWADPVFETEHTPFVVC